MLTSSLLGSADVGSPTIMADEGPRRDLWVSLGMMVSAIAAGFSSFAGLRGLAGVTGWGGMAPLFALCLDAYALTAIRVWLTSSPESQQMRAFARVNAVGAILLSLAGNAAWHLIAAGLVSVTWPIVMVVGGVPPVILGLVTHLAVLRRSPVPGQRPVPVSAPVVPEPAAEGGDIGLSTVPRVGPTEPVRPETGGPPAPNYATPEELLAAARRADEAHRAENGRPISRDQLRRVLGVSGTRATQTLRQLRASEADTAS
jgi:hypothetical protein